MQSDDVLTYIPLGDLYTVRDTNKTTQATFRRRLIRTVKGEGSFIDEAIRIDSPDLLEESIKMNRHVNHTDHWLYNTDKDHVTRYYSRYLSLANIILHQPTLPNKIISWLFNRLPMPIAYILFMGVIDIPHVSIMLDNSALMDIFILSIPSAYRTCNVSSPQVSLFSSFIDNIMGYRRAGAIKLTTTYILGIDINESPIQDNIEFFRILALYNVLAYEDVVQVIEALRIRGVEREIINELQDISYKLPHVINDDELYELIDACKKFARNEDDIAYIDNIFICNEYD